MGVAVVAVVIAAACAVAACQVSKTINVSVLHVWCPGAAAVSSRRLAVDAATAPMKDLTEDFSFFVGEATMVTVMCWWSAAAQETTMLCVFMHDLV